MSSKWLPLKEAILKPVTDEHIRHAAQQTGQSIEAIRADLERDAANVTYWLNDLYQVARRELYDESGICRMVHLNIRRRDGRVIFRDWRHFQWIKNQLVGEECEGVELYPAESRLSDTSNKYHIWCVVDPGYRFPFGMHNRDVMDDNGSRAPGYRQRKL